MFMRLPITVLFGGVVSIAVFWLLWTLISAPINVGPIVKATRINFTHVRKDAEIKTKQQQKVQRKPPPPAPKVPEMQFANGNLNNNVIDLAPVVNTGGIGNLTFSGGTDTDVIPLVRIPPEYPPRALSRGIQGWVVVQFTITETGAVTNAKVVDADPKNIFNDAALRAIARWRYNPKIEDGRPVQRVGVQTRIVFQLKGSG